MRAQLSRWVAIYAFCIVAASLYIGAYVLGFFGISIPVLRVAGGIIVAMSGWRMLTEPDATEQRRSETPVPALDRCAAEPARLLPAHHALDHRSRHHFGRDLHRRGPAERLSRLVARVLRRDAGGGRAAALLVYVFYRNSAGLAELIGATGTTIVVRLSAFLLFCIGIQVFWNGAAELLGTTCRSAADRNDG